ncbi:MAG: hypothetical protein RLZZ306_3064 [Bacteroidota bacterium]|jgi:hypothetical protein
MKLFKRNVFTTILILPYFYWWYYLIDWFALGHAKYPNSCGAANVGLIVLYILVISIYSIIMLINVIVRKGESRLDYVKFLLVIIIPVILLYFLFDNLTLPETNNLEFK